MCNFMLTLLKIQMKLTKALKKKKHSLLKLTQEAIENPDSSIYLKILS